MLGRPCTACGARHSVELVITDLGGGQSTIGFECIKCGAEYEQQSDAGEYDATLDLAAAIAQEEAET